MALHRDRRSHAPIAAQRPRSEFEQRVRAEAPAYCALARRLVDDTLTEKERVWFEWTGRVLELKGRGVSAMLIAEDLGITEGKYRAFIQQGAFRTIAQFIRDRAGSNDAKIVAERAKNERARFEALGPKALAFLEECLAVDEKGAFKSRADARWATAIIVKGKGWDEPQDAHRRLGEIKIGVIMAQQAAIRQSDQRIAGVDVEVEGTLVSVPMIEARDPEALDGDDVDEKDDFGFPEVPTPVPSE